jgi:hypothetical protein
VVQVLPPTKHLGPKNYGLRSEPGGYENLGTKFNGRFDYIMMSGDFKTYIVGMLNSTRFGRLDLSGNYIPFKNFPADFDPATDKLVTNRTATLVAEESQNDSRPLVWDTRGRLLPPLKLLPGCIGFTITNIDDSGAIFGSSFCPALTAPSAESVGLRITAKTTQTIGQWLNNAGVRNNLIPNTQVEMVSDNGKTVYGETKIEPVTGDRNSSTLRDTTGEHANNSSNDQYMDGPYAFLAHVP